MKTAIKLAQALLQVHIGVSMHPYPPARIDIPKSEFDGLVELAKQVLKEAGIPGYEKEEE